MQHIALLPLLPLLALLQLLLLQLLSLLLPLLSLLSLLPLLPKLPLLPCCCRGHPGIQDRFHGELRPHAREPSTSQNIPRVRTYGLGGQGRHRPP